MIVYDPNSVNPYGIELADTLGSAGIPCRGYVHPDLRDLTGPGEHPLWPAWVGRLPDTVPGKVVRHAALAVRVTGLSLRALARRETVVAVWTRSPADRIPLLLAARLGMPLVLVHHNPPGTRAGAVSRWEALLAQAATANVTHEERLRERLARTAPRTAVVLHPPYRRWARTYLRPAPRPGGGADLLFIGQFRPDKGLDELAAILPSVATRPLTLTLAGKGEVLERLAAVCAEHGVGLEVVGGSAPATDPELAAALARADLVVAPYLAPTQSGSLILALTAGVPAAAYAGGALDTLLRPRYLVPPGAHERFAAVVDDVLAGGAETYLTSAEEMAAGSAASWTALLGDAVPVTTRA